MKKYPILILFFLLFVSCQNFAKDETVTGKYHLVAVDILEDLSLSYQVNGRDYVGVVRETVFGIGYDDNYIIVKQHPSNNKKVTNYYIVQIYNENTLFPEKGVVGPLTLEEFNLKRKNLNIENISFTKVIEKLE